jgi:hypothetical protein
MKETKELVGFVLAVVSAVVESKSDDGQITLGDAPKFFNAMVAAPNAFIGADKIGAELKNLTIEEKNELMAEFREKFDITDDEIEELIEDAVEAAVALSNVIIRGVNFRK